MTKFDEACKNVFGRKAVFEIKTIRDAVIQILNGENDEHGIIYVCCNGGMFTLMEYSNSKAHPFLAGHTYSVDGAVWDEYKNRELDEAKFVDDWGRVDYCLICKENEE